MDFEDFNFHLGVMSGVRALGYTTPTPIQEKAIPQVMEGRDLIGLAQTGTGKTAAFVLPVLHRILTNRSTSLNKGVRAVIISPTRELAEQTCEVIESLGRKTGIRSLPVYGGVSMDQQIRALRRGIDIVVACPGRLLDHLWRGSIDLSHVEMLVIDEADRMFDMGFLPDIKSILKCLMNKRQTMLFSATMPPDIRKLVQDILHDPVTVQIGHEAPAHTVSHALYPVKQHLKTALIIEMLNNMETDSVLIFTRTKHRTEKVAEQLSRAGFKTTSLQGNLSQARRQAALDGFRRGYYKILVATDIAARGIDISTISHVINYDMPENTDAYTHRIGRTGRVDRTGDALTLITGADAPMVRDLERILKANIERRTVQGFNYKADAPEGERTHSRAFTPAPYRPPASRTQRTAGRRPFIRQRDSARSRQPVSSRD